ncbi:MAG: zf-HC2 domain-containing protein [Candidatus Limnocylindrales bacterium]
MSRPDRHAPYREALARQVDEALPAAEQRDLETHLAVCGPCRAVADAYAAQRGLLRGLRAMEPPRDLWARTATALDHELARGAGRPRLVALGSLASLGMMLAVAAGAAGVGPFGEGRPGAATPFPVTPEPIAFLTSEGNQITIYQTQVSEVCPAGATECGGPDPSSHPVISVDLAPALAPRDLTLGASGTLAITARDSQGNAVYSVLALPSSSGDAGPLATAWAPTGAATGSPRPTRTAPATPGHGHASAPPTKRPAGSPATSTPTAAATASAATADAQLEPILSDVIAAGAPAAWSSDGETLAFSARPADGSVGPDLYVWHVGDATVHALTSDHRSYFASWAGDRIVISRLPRAVVASPARTGHPAHTAAATTALDRPAAVTAVTVLVDPATGAASPVALTGAWLPSVDPTGHLAIYWQGTLMADGLTVDASGGALYLIDWAGLTGIPPTSAAPTATATARRSGAATAQPSEDATPTITAAASATPSDGPSASGADDQAQASQTPPLTGPSGAPSASATASHAGGPAGHGSGAVEAATDAPATSGTAGPGPDVAAPPLLSASGTAVTDWLVRWTPDGQTYGVWTAARPGSDAGSLLVAGIGAAAADPLSLTPALRGFSLGEGRVAWIAPDAIAPSGDLQIVTWGADGAGNTRLRLLGGATAAF